MTIVDGQRNRIGNLKQVTHDRKAGKYVFRLDNGCRLEISNQALFHHTLLKTEDECICFEFSHMPILSGMVAYTLFETYGFPLEYAIDEMNRHGKIVDEEGFHLLEKLSRERNKNTFINKNAFKQGKEL